MKKIGYILGATAVVVAAGAVAVGWHGPTQAPQTSASPVAVTASGAHLEISSDGHTVTYDGQAGQTALATLKAITKVEVRQTSLGELVTGINDVKAVSTKEFWSFYINGQVAQVGAGDYKSKAGDKIKWHVEQFQ